MAKSVFEKAIEKQAKEQNRQLQKRMRVEAASSIVNGQPIINNMRIMDEASEEIFEIILQQYDGNENRYVEGRDDFFPDSYSNSILLEFEKLKQYGVIADYSVRIVGFWSVHLTPQGIHYNEKKRQAYEDFSKVNAKQNAQDRKEYDVFISHATKDKTEYVNGLAASIRKLGVKIFYDTDIISWGDNWKRVIEEGTEKSEFAIIVISKNFFDREWTEIELNAFLRRQNESGQKIVLPLLHGITKNDLKLHYPQLDEIQVIDTKTCSEEDITILFAKELIKRYR